MLARKGVRKLEISLMQLFEILFTYIILKQFFNILATQNQNHYQNWQFLTKDVNF